MDFKTDAMLNQGTPQPKSNPLDSLLEVNHLTYETPKNLSVCVQRTVKSYKAQKSTYTDTNNSVIFTLQTGQQYVNWRNSSLKFGATVVTSDAKNSSFARGSACNFFKEIIVTSRSGVELARCNKFNVWRLITDHQQESSEWFDSVGAMMGYSSTYDIDDDTKYAVPQTQVTYIIPMSKLLKFFDVPRLCPQFLASGLRIELILEDKRNVVRTKAAATVTSYTISEPTMLIDGCILQETVIQKLNEISAQNGLEYVYENVYPESVSITTDTSDIDLSKAVSRALGTTTVTRLDAEILTDTKDSLTPEKDFKVTESQCRLGANYFPQSKITSEEEHYFMMLYKAGKLGDKSCNISLADFKDGALGAVNTTMERSNLLDYSGLPINNGQSLTQSLVFEDTLARTVDVFLTYVSVCKIFINNVTLTE